MTRAEPASAEVEEHQRNALYLLSALCMVFMTLVVAIQPLFLRNILNISFETAGAVNANVQVVTEVLDLFIFAYLGYLSDRIGRVRIIVAGFLVAAVGAVIAPLSPWIGGASIGALVVYYVSRVIMSAGSGAVWPQLSALAGDFSDDGNRARLLSNTAFMMAFGVTLVYAVLMQIPGHAGIAVTMLLTAAISVVGAWLARKFLVDVAADWSSDRLGGLAVFVRNCLCGGEIGLCNIGKHLNWNWTTRTIHEHHIATFSWR